MHDSPFKVTPISIMPSQPLNCSVKIVAWDELQINWKAPKDDGGEQITHFLLEYWSNEDSFHGHTEIQNIRMITVLQLTNNLILFHYQRVQAQVRLKVR